MTAKSAGESPSAGNDRLDAWSVAQQQLRNVADLIKLDEGLYNCLATPSERHSFTPIWKPPFISKIVKEDRCHLNGLAMEDGTVIAGTVGGDSLVAVGFTLFFGVLDVIKFSHGDVLTVGDNLRRTVEHVPAEAAAQDPALKSFLDGVELTERELLNVLERHGVTRIEPLGQRFDPNCHQAMYEVQNPEVPEGTVVDVMQAGYVIGDRCLRPALVAVAKGGVRPAKPEANKGGGAKPPKAANDDIPGGGWQGD